MDGKKRHGHACCTTTGSRYYYCGVNTVFQIIKRLPGEFFINVSKIYGPCFHAIHNSSATTKALLQACILFNTQTYWHHQCKQSTLLVWQDPWPAPVAASVHHHAVASHGARATARSTWTAWVATTVASVRAASSASIAAVRSVNQQFRITITCIYMRRISIMQA